MNTLTNGRTPWKKNAQHEVVTYPASCLTQGGRFWNAFISSVLMPRGHMFYVTRNRAILNYAITMDMHFDVGKMI